MVDEFPNNASATQTGFHYQDFSALYFFVSNIKNIMEINIEGHDDFDIKYSNGDLAFFQVKEIQDVSKALTTQKINQSLKVLASDIKNFNHISNIVELGIITNTNFPFGLSSRDTFTLPYMQLSYDQLASNSKKKIDRQFEKLNEEQKATFDIHKLTITKLHYYGNDTSSKLQQLEFEVRKLLGSAKIVEGKYDALLNEWRMMFSQSTENASEKISRESFTLHTEIIVLDSPRFDEFYNLFDIDTKNEGYIETQYNKHLKMLSQDFKVISKIEAEFEKFRLNNFALKRSDRNFKFITELAPRMLNLLGLTKCSADLDIAKLIIWLVIRQRSLLSTVEEAFGIVH